MKDRRIWRVIVMVTDRPEGREDYLTEDEIKKHLNGSPEAGVDIQVADMKAMGSL